MTDVLIEDADSTGLPAVSGNESRDSPKAIYNIVLLFIVTVAARMIVFGNPVVGFDEQFYLLVGDRMLHGALPFVDIFDRKPVGIFLIYAGVRLLGGEGFLQYKLVAALAVFATAVLIYFAARRRSGSFGATLAAIIYVLWLDFMEGEGGQTPVFYNLLVLGAAVLMLDAARVRKHLFWRGGAALLLVGVALQIKYSVLFEGIYIGCAFLFLARRSGVGGVRFMGFCALLVGLAVLPTALVGLYYWAVGHGAEFVFCNFVSIFGQGKGSFLSQIFGLVVTVVVMLPLILFGLVTRHAVAKDAAPGDRALLIGWLTAAICGVLIYWRFNSPHYALPLVAPTCLLLAPAFRMRRYAAVAFALVAFVAGQIVLTVNMRLKGANAEARAVAALAKPNSGCLFVYDGYPALYMLTHSCLPSRWAFPGHLNAADEAYPSALGADPVAVTRAVLASRPDTIADVYPTFAGQNPATRRVVMEAIREHYVLQACIVTPGGRTKLVYRLRGEKAPRLLDRCPAALLGQER